MGILLDLALLATVVISLLLGVRSGVVRSLVGFAGGLFAMAASAMLSGFAADVLCGLVGQSHEATPVEYNLIRVIATVILYVGLQFLVFLAGRALDQVFKLPGLNLVNRVIGGAFGALRGAVIAALLCVVLTLALPYMKAEGEEPLPPETLQESFLYRQLYENNPIALLFSQE